MNTIEFVGDKVLRHTATPDKRSNILRLHNMDTGEYEEYLLQEHGGCYSCCMFTSHPDRSVRSCRFSGPFSPCSFLGYRPLTKMDTVLEDL